MSRALHFWGPPPRDLVTDHDVIRWYVRHALGSPVTALPAARHPHWAIAYLQACGQLTDVFEPVDDGGPADRRGYRVRSGVTLRPEHVPPASVDDTLRQVAVLREIRHDHPELANTRLLVPLLHPIDLAVLTHVGPSLPAGVTTRRAQRAVLDHLPVYVDAVVQLVDAVTAAAGPDVLFALDMPSALVGVWKGPLEPSRRPAAEARWHAGVTAKLLSAITQQAEVVLELGYTDDNYADVFRPTDLVDVTSYLNRLARDLLALQLQLPRWRTRPQLLGRNRPNARRRLPAVYLPLAFGLQPPPSTPDFYAGLTRLDSAWNRLIPGVVDGTRRPISHGALALFETAAGRPSFAVAQGCGGPTRPAVQVEGAINVQRALAGAKAGAPATDSR